MKNKKGAQFTVKVIILLILGLVVLFLAFYLLFNAGFFDYFRNLPGSEDEAGDETVELSDEELMNFNCDVIAGKVGKGTLDFKGKPYIYIDDVRTSLYWVFKGDGEVYLDGRKNPIGEYKDGELAIDSLFLDEKSYESVVLKDKLPSVEKMKLLDGAFWLEDVGYLCKSEEQLEEDEKCAESCFGSCKNSCLAGEVFVGVLNCGKLVCCVSELEENLESEGLKIKEFKATLWKASSNKVDDLLGLKELSVVYGMEGLRKVEFEIEGRDFCHVLKTNERVLKVNGFWVPSANERILELSAWNPEDKSKRVVKRLVVKPELPKLPRGYEKGEAVKGDLIYGVVSKAKTGSVFYVFGVGFDWSKKGGYTSATRDYKIKKVNGNEVEISVYDVYPDELKWHKLDCVSDFNVFGWGDKKAVEILKLKKGLLNVLAEYCGW